MPSRSLSRSKSRARSSSPASAGKKRVVPKKTPKKTPKAKVDDDFYDVEGFTGWWATAAGQFTVKVRC